MTASEAIRREEAREIMAGLLKALDEKALEAK